MEKKASKSMKLQNIIPSVKSWYRGLPDKKRYLEFITAFLTIPVLLTVFLSNVNNLKRQTPQTEPTPNPTIIIREIPSSNSEIQTPTERDDSASPTLTPTPSAECIPQIGSVEITSPDENQTLQTNPVCIDIVRSSQNYCSVVWAYRINTSAWSDYTNKSICLYDMSPGKKLLELRIKSVVTGEEMLLKRSFIYGLGTPTPSTASQSASTP